MTRERIAHQSVVRGTSTTYYHLLSNFRPRLEFCRYYIAFCERHGGEREQLVTGQVSKLTVRRLIDNN